MRDLHGTITKTNQYRVTGDFEYVSYCQECQHCGGHNAVGHIKNLLCYGDTESEAIADAAETLQVSMDYAEACFLYGYPSIKFVQQVQVGAPGGIANYWLLPPALQGKIRSAYSLQRKGENDGTSEP